MQSTKFELVINAETGSSDREDEEAFITRSAARQRSPGRSRHVPSSHARSGASGLLPVYRAQLHWTSVSSVDSNRVASMAMLRARISSWAVLVPVEMRSPQEVPSAFATMARERVGAVMVMSDALTVMQRDRIAELALKSRLPTIFPLREYVVAGGLMAYGENIRDFFRRAAFYVDKTLRGAKPMDLPIEQPF